MTRPRLDVSLYAIVDPQIARGRSLAELAWAAAAGGATLIQYRAKATATATMIVEMRAIKAALAGSGVPLLVNDRVDVALAAGADGVHLGRDDMLPDDARRLLGPSAIIGATIKDAGDIDGLARLPLGIVDYGCIGGVYATTHKDNADAPLGVERYAALRAIARDRLGAMPIGAIAGITAENLTPLIAGGADGVAVIGAVFASDDVTAATRALARAIATARGRPA